MQIDVTVTVSIKRRKQIPSKIRDIVWERNVNKRCYVCNDRVKKKNYHCSHVIPEKRNGKGIPSNLRVCCQGCNLAAGTYNLRHFKKSYFRNNRVYPKRKRRVF